MLKGIDVSYANGTIDWAKAKKNIDFAIIRSTFGSDLPSQTDSFFTINADACVKNNIPFGTYHFAYFVDQKTAKAEAEFAIRKAGEYRKYVQFIALDVEEDSVRYANRIGKNPDWTKCAITFLERIKRAGFTPVLYTNQNWILNIYDYEQLKDYKLWYAAPEASAPKFNPTIWQYSWKGKVPGIDGNVDMDFLYDDTFIKKKNNSSTINKTSDINTFLNKARSYIGYTGKDVCITKLKLGAVYDWCAFAVSSIMKDCGFIGKYINAIQGGAGDIPRYSDKKYGTWFIKGATTPQAGDLIFFRYAGTTPTDKYFSSHVGIVEGINKNIITTLEGNVEGTSGNWAATSTFKRKTRDFNSSDVYAFYRPNWGKAPASTVTTTTSATTTTSKTIDVTYQVYVGGKWLPNVKNTEDYAGIETRRIQGIYMNPSKGRLRYRVKLVGSTNYLPWVVNREDYAGIFGKDIDCVQIELLDCEGYTVQYRVSTTTSLNYLSWITGYNNNNEYGYAGIKGKPIDKLQIKIVKK